MEEKFTLEISVGEVFKNDPSAFFGPINPHSFKTAFCGSKPSVTINSIQINCFDNAVICVKSSPLHYLHWITTGLCITPW